MMNLIKKVKKNMDYKIGEKERDRKRESKIYLHLYNEVFSMQTVYGHILYSGSRGEERSSFKILVFLYH